MDSHNEYELRYLLYTILNYVHAHCLAIHEDRVINLAKLGATRTCDTIM